MLWHRILEVLQTMTTITQPPTDLERTTLPSVGVHGVLPRSKCPAAARYGNGPPPKCTLPSDPNNLPPSQLEKWFTKDMFVDLFPFANLGWGPNPCQPYSYEAFVIAARYFPNFGTSSPNSKMQ
ncbi:hypothetical protein COOONC_15111 [Cooperia oncophora]